MLDRAVDGGADGDAGETDEQDDDAGEETRAAEGTHRTPQAVNSSWCSVRTSETKAVSSG